MTSDLYPILTERVQRTWGYSVTGNPGEVKITIAMDELPAVPGLGIIVYEADEFLPGPGYSFYPLDVNGSNYETLLIFAGSGVFTIGTEPLVSVPDYAFVEVLLFPNPAQETVSSQLSHAGGVSWTFNLYDALGKKVNSSSHTGPLATVNVASLSPGIYTSEIVIEKDQRFYVRLLKR